VAGVSAMHRKILDLLEEVIKKYDLRSLRMRVSAAENLPMEVHKRWKELTGCELYEGHGLTEH